MDTTMMSEMEYINILPDLEKINLDDSSFLKGGSFFVNPSYNKLDNSDN